MGAKFRMIHLLAFLLVFSTCQTDVEEIESISISQQGMFIQFSEVKKKLKIYEITLQTNDEDIVFIIPMNRIITRNNLVEIPMKTMIEMKGNTNFLTNHEYKLIFKMSGHYVISQIFIGNPINNYRTNIFLNEGEGMNSNAIILWQENLYY